MVQGLLLMVMCCTCSSQTKGREEGEGDMEVDGTSFIHAMQKMFGKCVTLQSMK